VRTFVQAFVGQAVPKLADPRAFLEATAMQASQAIVDFAHAHHRTEHPRTTVVAAVVQDGELTALPSGDSRLYGARDERLVARTHDHSYHDKPGRFATRPAGVSRSVLCTGLRLDAPLLYDVLGPVALRHGDRVLLCSGGLWAVIDDDLAAGQYGVPLADAVARLSELAVRRGGRHGDNVSLIGLMAGRR